jgi:hypothetical protein
MGPAHRTREPAQPGSGRISAHHGGQHGRVDRDRSRRDDARPDGSRLDPSTVGNRWCLEGDNLAPVWTKRLAGWSVVLIVAAGVLSVVSGLLAFVWFPDLPDQSPDACTDPPCWDLDVDGASVPLILPFIAHVVLLGLALLIGGIALLLGLVAAVRGHGRNALGLAAVAVAGPVLVLVGGELVPHLVNPCVLPDVAGAEAPGFCVTTPQGTDVPDKWHTLDHAVVGFLPVSLLVAWWWRRSTSRDPVGPVNP